MSEVDEYVSEINSLKKSLKALNGEKRSIKKDLEKAKFFLYNYMTKRDLKKYKNITLKSVTPKSKIPSKPAREKEKAAIEFFGEIGFAEPKEVYQQFLKTQKYEPVEFEKEEVY